MLHIAIEPPETVEAKLVKQVADTLKIEVYEARLHLSGRIPKLVYHTNSIEAAELISKNLSSLGLSAVVINDTVLQKPLSTTPEFKAYSIQFEEKQVRFLSKNGVQKIISGNDLSLLLYAKINVPETTSDTTVKMKLNLPATLMTGGIPIMRKSEEKMERVSYQSEYFIRLYGWMSLEPEIEIFECGFNYDFLGTKITPASSENMKILISELKKTFPDVVVDSRLTEGSPLTQGNDLENACRLIVLFQRAKSNTKL